MKILRVDMSALTVTTENVPEAYQGLGGRGITSVLINEEVPANCDPLGPENELVLAPGLLSGTSFPNTSRLSIGAKSPLTGGIKESNAGGTVCLALARLGITAIVVTGQPSDGNLYLLHINQNGEAKLYPAQGYKGTRTYGFVETMRAKFGKRTAMLCIGPAGEYGMRAASIQSTDMDGRPCRAAGRGGLGAVMGAKGLKAILVDQRGKVPDAIHDPKAFKAAARAFAKAVKENPLSSELLPTLGTAGLVAPINAMGAFPCFNATRGVLADWEKISGETMAGLIKKRGGKSGHMGCAQCVVRCSNEFVDRKGSYVTASLEYETIWAMGGMTGITDLDTIARLDFLCDDIGVDTMSTGVAVAVAMDAGYKPFGHGHAAIQMVEEIASGTEMGNVLGNGPAAVGRYFAHDRVPVVKGQSIAAYDPRAMQGNAVTYATSPMGADHTAGNVVGEYMSGNLDPLSVVGQVEASRNIQIVMAAVDAVGLCLFAGFALATPVGGKALLDAINAKLGTQLDQNAIPEIGMRILKAELAFNRNAGLDDEDDRLPRFFYEEPLPPHNKVVMVSSAEIDGTFKFLKDAIRK